MNAAAHIAVADANLGALAHTGRYLKNAFPGVRLASCSAPDELLETLATERPDVTVLGDVGHPKLLKETIRRIRDAGFEGGLVVVSIFEEFGQSAHEAGADAFIPAKQWRGLPQVVARLMPAIRPAA